MNRRAFLFVPKGSAPPTPGEQYAVRLWSVTTNEDWHSEISPGGIYGYFEVGSTVVVDLSSDFSVYYISDVNSYASSSEKVPFQYLDDTRVSFIMPGFEVAVEIETNY